jgi:hypothetical protein
MANVVSEHSDSTNDPEGGGAGSHAGPTSESPPSPGRQGGTIGIGTPDGGTNRIATNDTRLLNAVFQSDTGTQRLWTSHTISYTWPGENEARSIIRWYEIDVPTQSIAQSNGFGRAGAYYYFPAIQTDIGRITHLVFGRSSENEYAHSRQTGRRTTDPPNELQGSAAVSTGLSAYIGGRWGDYFGICRDPADRSVVWMFGEHADSGGQCATRVASTRF